MLCVLIRISSAGDSNKHPQPTFGRRGGLVVERQTPEREVGGSILSRVQRVVSFSKIHLPPKKYW